MKSRVLVTDNLSAAGLEILNSHPDIELDVRSGLSTEELKAALQEADGIIIRSGTKLKADILAGQRRLKAIVRAGVGVDNIDVTAATKEGIIVMNTPAGNTISTAEQTIAMMMSLVRNIAPAHASMKAGKWDRKYFTGSQLAGKTLGVVGLGRVGIAVAQRAIGLEMKVLGYDPFISADRAAELGIELYRDIDEMIVKCDIATVHTPLNDQTTNLLNKERLAKMPKGARVINCARGGIVNENDLADALESGHIAGAALDVFVNEPPEAGNRLIGQNNILLTPHLGASTEEAQELVALEAAEIIVNFFVKNEVRHAVNIAPVSASEMQGVKRYIDLAYRLGLLLGQQSEGQGIKSVQLQYKGDVSGRPTKLMTSAFTCGLLHLALGDRINIVNSQLMASERHIAVQESTTKDSGDFTSLIQATVETDNGKVSAAGTIFGNEYLRLVRLNGHQLDAYLDGILLIYRHQDKPGLIGHLGTIFGKHGINIAHLALGREKLGGNAVAVVNLDSMPSEQAVKEVSGTLDVNAVDIVKLPTAGAGLPWLGL